VAVSAAIVASAARGQQDLDAGRSGPQLFSQDCTACHRSPQGLTRLTGGSLVSYLRQHYTSSANSANAIAAYLQAAGAGRAAPKGRPGEEQAKQREDHAKQSARSKLGRQGEPSTAAAPGSDPAGTQPAPGRKQKERLARPGDPAADQPGGPGRKSRPSEADEAEQSGQAAEAPAESATAAVQPSPAEASAPAPAAAAAAPAAEATPAAAPAPPPPPGFLEPLP
jgi:hypothetical protein